MPAATCAHCGVEFPSKTALFKHLKSSDCTAKAVADGLKLPAPAPTKIVLFVGYLPRAVRGVAPDASAQDIDGDYVDDLNSKGVTGVQRAVWNAIHAVLGPEALNGASNASPSPSPSPLSAACPSGTSEGLLLSGGGAASETAKPSRRALTWARDATRPISFSHATSHCARVNAQVAQDDIPAVCDVMTSTGPPPPADYVARLNEHLPSGIRVLGKLIANSNEFHAEKSCYQRVYDCIVPLTVLFPNLTTLKLDEEDCARKAFEQTGSKDLGDARNVALLGDDQPRLIALRSLKAALKKFEGKHAWHNFIPGAVPGGLSVQGTVFRFYRHSCIAGPGSSGEFVQLRIVGDSFGKGQVASMLGLTIAVMRGQLPVEYIDACLDPQGAGALFPVPSAPTSSICLNHVTYPWYEVHHSQLIRPDDWNLGGVAKTTRTVAGPGRADGEGSGPVWGEFTGCGDHAIGMWRRTVIEYLMESDRAATIRDWANGLQSICEDIERARKRQCVVTTRGAGGGVGGDAVVPAGHASHGASADCPTRIGIDAFVSDVIHREHLARVVALLEAADKGGHWPRSSHSRVKVIDSASDERGGTFALGYMGRQFQEPVGNKLFPELFEAAFRLERVLLPTRVPSSTIAVNRHAQFKPHKDSGAGAGQSTSLIIGLGDYDGGEIVVEGVPHDIRYNAIEFNGWTQRHWTNPFVGQRYSLVWFTPQGCEESSPLLKEFREETETSSAQREETGSSSAQPSTN